MSATEWWLLAAAIAAGVSVLLTLLVVRVPAPLHPLASALHAAAVGLVAVALILALP